MQSDDSSSRIECGLAFNIVIASAYGRVIPDAQGRSRKGRANTDDNQQVEEGRANLRAVRVT